MPQGKKRGGGKEKKFIFFSVRGGRREKTNLFLRVAEVGEKEEGGTLCQEGGRGKKRRTAPSVWRAVKLGKLSFPAQKGGEPVPAFGKGMHYSKIKKGGEVS